MDINDKDMDLSLELLKSHFHEKTRIAKLWLKL